MSQTRSAGDASILAERAAGLSAVLGAFIMVGAAVFTVTGTMGIHNALVGALTAFIAAFHAYRIGTTRSPSIVIAGVLALIGIWIAAAPFVLGVTRELVIGINGVAGALIAILSLAGVYGGLQTSKRTGASA